MQECQIPLEDIENQTSNVITKIDEVANTARKFESQETVLGYMAAREHKPHLQLLHAVSGSGT
jgi:hypothetical protein